MWIAAVISGKCVKHANKSRYDQSFLTVWYLIYATQPSYGHVERLSSLGFFKNDMLKMKILILDNTAQFLSICNGAVWVGYYYRLSHEKVQNKKGIRLLFSFISKCIIYFNPRALNVVKTMIDFNGVISPLWNFFYWTPSALYITLRASYSISSITTSTFSF